MVDLVQASPSHMLYKYVVLIVKMKRLKLMMYFFISRRVAINCVITCYAQTLCNCANLYSSVMLGF